MHPHVLTRRRLIGTSLALGGGALLGSAVPALAAGRATAGGFSADGLKRLTQGLAPFVDSGEAVGLVTLLYRHGQVAQVDALGWQDREAKLPMRRDTLFRMASMTKPVTSVAVLMLVEEGKIGLNDPVDRWLPELANRRVLNNPAGPLDDTHPAPRPITVLDLLTHRSGLAYNFTATGPLAAAYQTVFDARTATTDRWMALIGELPLAFDPGQRWHYSHATDVLGALVERVSGKPFAQVLQDRIFAPLGMADTAFHVPADKAGRLAVAYGHDGAGNRVRAPLATPTAPPPFASGGGGLASTADDYLKFARMLLDLGRAPGTGKGEEVRLLSRRTVRLMTSNWLTPEQRKVQFAGIEFWGGQGFGLGVSVADDLTRPTPTVMGSKGAFGWPGAFGTWFQADPVEDMVMIYLVQNAANLGASAVAPRRTSLSAFQDLTYAAIEEA